MLDLEIVTEPTDSGTDIVSVDDMKKHLRLLPSNNSLNDVIEDAINEAAASLHGITGILNRTIFPTTYRRYLNRFPRTYPGSSPVIQLPYPPLISVSAVTIEDGSSPENDIPVVDYLVNTTSLVGYLQPKASVEFWPTVDTGARAVSVTYRAGYLKYPLQLRRLVKILAAHNVENAEATINEPRQMMINRRVDFGHDYLVNQLRVPHSYDDWE